MLRKRLFSVWLMILMMVCGSLNAQVNHRHFLMNGRISLSEERFVDAIRYFNTAISARPELFEAYFLRGVAKFNLGDFQGAIEDYTTTLGIHPLYVRAYHYRGIAHDRVNNYYDATKDFEKALSIDPFDAGLHVANGATRMHLRDYAGAVRDYDMALLINPALSYAYLNRGIAKRFLGMNEDALSDFDKAVYHDYFDADTWIRRGMLKAEMGLNEAAMEDFNQAGTLDENNPLLYFQRALLFLQSGDTLAALNDFEKVNILDNRNALTYYNRALIHGLKNELKEAEVLYNEVIMINPENVYAWFNRGITRYRLGDLSNAEQDFTEALRLFPDFAGAWINRSVVKQDRGKSRESRADYDRAMEIIRQLNSTDSDAELLYARYADSAYFDRIIALESDFISGEARAGRVQFREVDINPYGLFVVRLQSTNQTTGNERPQETIDVSWIDPTGLPQGHRLMLYRRPISYHGARNETAKAVERAENETADCASLLEYAVYHQDMGNYRYALDLFTKAGDCGEWALVFMMNKGYLLALLEEVHAADNLLLVDVMVAPRQSSSVKDELDRIPDHSRALAEFRNLIRRQPNNAYAWYNAATIRLQMKQFHKAIEDYTEALLIEPKLAEAYFNRGLTLLYLGAGANACADLSKAGELGIQEAYSVIRKYCVAKGQ
jgi:tetratricopeptide (TPR) repeat protein